MAQSGVSVAPECISEYNKLKLERGAEQPKWIIFKISDDWKEIVVEKSSKEDNYDAFRQHLIDAKSKDKRGNECVGGRYAVYDVKYSTPDGDRNKITFISWVPDNAGLQPRMMYSSSKEALKRSLTGLAAEVQANDPDDIEHSSIIERVSKGKA